MTCSVCAGTINAFCAKKRPLEVEYCYSIHHIRLYESAFFSLLYDTFFNENFIQESVYSWELKQIKQLEFSKC